MGVYWKICSFIVGSVTEFSCLVT